MRPPSLASQRQGLRDLAALLVAGVAAGLLVYFLFHGKLTRFEDIGLGNNTAAVFASVGGDPIHCGDMLTVPACLAGFRKRGSTNAALWLGNSQLHGVNQWRPGEQTAAARLAESLRAQGIDLITLSQPNGNLQEHLVLYAYVRTRLPLHTVLLPAVFDDMRESEVRGTIAPALDDPAVRAVLEASEIGRTILATTKRVEDPDLAALDQTLQEKSEASLNRWLDRHVELWDLRPEARGRIGQWIFQVRNFVFGITSHSKRRMIAGRYVQNLAAAEAILADAHEQGIRVLLYVAPLRGDVELPYVENEYLNFQHELEALAGRYGAQYVNLGDAVPPDLFGVTDATTVDAAADVDFMHFQAGGHAILAERLAAALAAPHNGGPQ
jgi:hypothetical protein